MKKIKKVFVSAMALLPLCVLASCNKPSESIGDRAYMGLEDEVTLIKKVGKNFEEKDNTLNTKIQKISLNHPNGYSLSRIEFTSGNVVGYQQLDEFGALSGTVEFYNLKTGKKLVTVDNYFSNSSTYCSNGVEIFRVIHKEQTITNTETSLNYVFQYYSGNGDILYTSKSSSHYDVSYINFGIRTITNELYQLDFSSALGDASKTWYVSIDEDGNTSFLNKKPEDAKLPLGVTGYSSFDSQDEDPSYYYNLTNGSLNVYDLENNQLRHYLIGDYLLSGTTQYMSAIVGDTAIFFLRTNVPHKVTNTVGPEKYDVAEAASNSVTYYDYSVLSVDLVENEIKLTDTDFYVTKAKTVEVDGSEELFVNAKTSTQDKVLSEASYAFSFNTDNFDLDKKLNYISDVEGFDYIYLVTDAKDTEYAFIQSTSFIQSTLVNLETKDTLQPNLDNTGIVGEKLYFLFMDEFSETQYITNDYSVLTDLSNAIKVANYDFTYGYNGNPYAVTFEHENLKIQEIMNNELSTRTIKFTSSDNFYEGLAMYSIATKKDDGSSTYSLYDLAGEQLGSGYTSCTSQSYSNVKALTCYNSVTKAITVFAVEK